MLRLQRCLRNDLRLTHLILPPPLPRLCRHLWPRLRRILVYCIVVYMQTYNLSTPPATLPPSSAHPPSSLHSGVSFTTVHAPFSQYLDLLCPLLRGLSSTPSAIQNHRSHQSPSILSPRLSSALSCTSTKVVGIQLAYAAVWAESIHGGIDFVPTA